MRIFIAIDLPATIKEAVSALQNELRDCSASVVWTPAEKLHLTLKFLGEIDDRRVRTVAEIVENVSMCRHRLTINLKNTGVFPNPGNPRILWVGLGGQVQELVQLAAVLDQDLSRLGFAGEKRTYRPHLTIGRFKSPVNAGELLDRIANAPIHSESFEIKELTVVRSVLRPGGSRYIPLYAFPLCR